MQDIGAFQIDPAVRPNLPFAHQRRAEQHQRPVPPLQPVGGDAFHESRLDGDIVELRGGLFGIVRLDPAFFELPRDATTQPCNRIGKTTGAQLLHLDHQTIPQRERTAHRQGRVQHDQCRDLLARRRQLARNLQRGDPAARETAQHIGAMRLHLPHLRDVIPRGIHQIAMRRLIAIKPARLQPIEGTVRAQKMRQMPQVQDIAEHARHQEEGRARSPLAHMHGHDMGKSPLRRGRLGRHLALGPRHHSATLLDQRGTGTDRGRLEQDRNREIHVERLAHLGKQAHGNQRVTAQIKETVLDPHGIQPQQLLPEPGQTLFHIRLGRDKIAVELGPLETLPAGIGSTFRRIHLPDQRRQIHGRDHHLRLTRGQRPQKRLGPFLGADALGQHVAQTLLGG